MKEKEYIKYVNIQLSNYLIGYYMKFHIEKNEIYYA